MPSSLVIGDAGRTGRHIVGRLRRDGAAVKVLSHNPDRVPDGFEANHSFDNLYGTWEGVNGIANADPAHTRQVNQAGTPFTCLLQNDVNLATPPLSATCHDTTTAMPFDSHFANKPFRIDDFIAPSDTTCPPPGDFSK